ncbi:hypothetical protein Dimus_029476 [Dionaea muscipula]
MWRRSRPRLIFGLAPRRLSTAVQRRILDEGDWSYSSEWWGNDSDVHSHTVFRGTSDKGNGVVSVLGYPCSRPSPTRWLATERWLEKRYAEVCPDSTCDGKFCILGYQWRVLRFNDDTRQSTVKVMAASKLSEPGSLFFMQQGHCLAVPYTKSMVSVGLVSLASCKYTLRNAARGKETMRVLCIGHGGGSLPLFLANTIRGAIVDIVEIDPLVISASTKAMGFPSFSIATPTGPHAMSKPDTISEVLWRGIHERLFLYEDDAEQFILNTQNPYDIVFIDAYDGDDIFPHKLWDPQSPFLEALACRLHPEHGTVVVNLHSDMDIRNSDGSVSSFLQPVLPMGKYISQVCCAYKDVLLGNWSRTKKFGLGLGFVVSVPSLCNTTLVVSRGFPMNRGILDRGSVLKTLISNSIDLDNDLDLPFSCLQFIKTGFLILE